MSIKENLLISIIFSLLFSGHSCIVSNDNRDIYRQEYIEPEQIQSENFVIHFTVADDDFQEINGQLYSLQSNYGYAQSIIDLAEYSLSVYLENGWENLPPDPSPKYHPSGQELAIAFPKVTLTTLSWAMSDLSTLLTEERRIKQIYTH